MQPQADSLRERFVTAVAGPRVERLESRRLFAAAPVLIGPLSPVVAKTSFPAAVIAGVSRHGTATVSLANQTTALVKEPATLQVFACADGSIDGTSVLLGTVTRKVSVKAESAFAVGVGIKSLPAGDSGTYTLLAEVTDPSGTAVAATGPTLVVAAPFILFSKETISTSLKGSAITGESTKATATLSLTNLGNITSTGISVIELLIIPVDKSALPTPVRSVNEKISLKPGKGKTLKLPLGTFPGVDNGSYEVIADITDSKGDITSTADLQAVSFAAPFLDLAPVLLSLTAGPHGTGTVKVTIVNEGNIQQPTGITDLAIYASTTSEVANATQGISDRFVLPLEPGQSKAFTYKLTASMMTSVISDGTLIAEVIDPLNGVETTAIAG